MDEGAAGDEVEADAAQLGEGGEGDTAAGFGGGAAGDEGDGFDQVRGGDVYKRQR